MRNHLFDEHPLIDGIVTVCIDSWIPFLESQLKKFEINKVKKIVPGGKTGQESIFNGLVAVKKYFGESTVIVIAHHIQMVKDFKHIIVVDNKSSDNLLLQPYYNRYYNHYYNPSDTE